MGETPHVRKRFGESLKGFVEALRVEAVPLHQEVFVVPVFPLQETSPKVAHSAVLQHRAGLSVATGAPTTHVGAFLQELSRLILGSRRR